MAKPAMTTSHEKLWSIQYLRFVAAFGVVVFHSCSGTAYEFPLGADGVHLFFVISGFVMWRMAAINPQTLQTFWGRRIRRIVPLYWAAIVLVVMMVRFLGVHPLASTDQIGPVVKSMLFIPYRSGDGSMFPVIYQGWTLNYEMFFYVVFGLVLLAPPPFRLSLLAISFIALWWCGSNYDADNPLLATYLDPVCIEFLFGVIAAELSLRFRSPGWMGAGALISGVVLVWLAEQFDSLPEFATRLGVAAGISAIVMGFVALEAAGKLPRIGWLKYGGEASYALYLFQIFGFEAVRPLIGAWPGGAKALAFAGSALLAGLLAHRLIEKPIADLLKPRPGGPPARDRQPLQVQAP